MADQSLGSLARINMTHSAKAGDDFLDDEGDDEGDEEGTDIDHVPDIRDLQYTISHDGVGNKTYNLSELLNVSSEEEKVTPKPKARRGRPRKKQS